MNQFEMEGYNPPFRLDRNKHGGGIILFVREGIPAKILNDHHAHNDFEHLFVEINLRSKKWLISCSYNPNVNSIAKHLNQVSQGIDFYAAKYENHIFLGDFNAEATNPFVEDFCVTYRLKIFNQSTHLLQKLLKSNMHRLNINKSPQKFSELKCL